LHIRCRNILVTSSIVTEIQLYIEILIPDITSASTFYGLS
jgi:hypothetical protein